MRKATFSIIFLALAILITMFMVVSYVVAQDILDPTPAPQVDEGTPDAGYIPPQDIGAELAAFLDARMTVPEMIGVIVFLTGLVKRFFPQLPPRAVWSFFVILTYAIYSVATQAGFQLQVDNAADVIARIGDLILGLGGFAAASHYSFKVAKHANIPVLGWTAEQVAIKASTQPIGTVKMEH